MNVLKRPYEGDLVAVWAESNQARDVCEVAAAGRFGTVGSGPVALRGRPRRFGSTQGAGATLKLSNSETLQM